MYVEWINLLKVFCLWMVLPTVPTENIKFYSTKNAIFCSPLFVLQVLFTTWISDILFVRLPWLIDSPDPPAIRSVTHFLSDGSQITSLMPLFLFLLFFSLTKPFRKLCIFLPSFVWGRGRHWPLTLNVCIIDIITKNRWIPCQNFGSPRSPSMVPHS